jgi:hypothetical protein
MTVAAWRGRPWLWACVAAASLAIGVWIAVLPGRSLDLQEVTVWAATWDFGRGNPYAVSGLRMDYPPHALLLLGSFHLLPAGAAPALFAGLNLIVCVLAVRLTVQVTLEGAGVAAVPSDRLVLVAILLTFGVFRSSLWLGQLMPVAWLFLLVAIREAGRRPMLAGLCLGLGLFKLNLAAAVVLYLLTQRRWRVLVAGAGAVLSMTAVVAWMTGVTPWAIVADYLTGMIAMYGPAGYVPDWLSLRGMVEHPLAQIAVAAYLVITGGLLARLTARRSLSDAHVLALWLLWTLQAVSHQRFNLVMAVPAVLLLSPIVRLGAAPWAFLVVVAFLAVDLPWIFMHTGMDRLADWSPRVLVLGLFGWLGREAWLARRSGRGLSASV